MNVRQTHERTYYITKEPRKEDEYYSAIFIVFELTKRSAIIYVLFTLFMCQSAEFNIVTLTMRIT
jgi:hypothetical protein